ncbi:MAG: hypothetical protein AB1942_07085 [Pseudomonadota bacterium]
MPDLQDVHDRLSKIESLLLQRIPGGGVTDPAPGGFDIFGPARDWRVIFGAGGWRPPLNFDPVPIDLARLSRAQLEVARESLKTERVRLDSLEQLLDRQIKELG